jgi:TPR repeat protein
MNLARFARLAAFFLAASLSLPTIAGPSEDADAAYINGDYASALRLWRELAQQGDAPAQTRLGRMYRDGRGVLRDDQQAVEWFRKAAEKDNASAQTALGYMYQQGRGVAGDYNEALQWFRKAAEQGYAPAQNNLGAMYLDGHGVAKDEAEAVQWFRKAAEQGNAGAQVNLGVMYQNGRGGLPQDDQQAVEWYRKAAEQDNATAQTRLGSMYATGRGVAKDEAEAVRWYRKAAEQGDTKARTLLSSTERAQVANEKADKRTYAVLSLIGDKLSIVGYVMTTGSHADRNRHDTITLNNRELDDAATLAASNAVKRLDARAATVLLASSDPRLYELQDKLFEQQDQSIALLESVKAMIESQHATHLVLITKHRGDAQLRMAKEYVGSGMIEGVGFYLDAALRTMDSDTAAVAKGFLAPFAYIKVTLVNAKTMAVIREQNADESTTLSTARAKGSLNPWDALTPAQKVTALQNMISKAIARVMPDVLGAK